MSELIREINDDDFEQVVLQSDQPVLVDFWAPWCGPCRALAPTLDDVAASRAGRARVVKLNVDNNPAGAERFAVRAIPTLVLFQSGKEADRLIGAASRAEITRRLDRLIEAKEEKHGSPAL